MFLIDSPGEAAFVLTLDANSRYWQIEIEGSDRDKSAFTSHRGLNQFFCMPFRLWNAFETFQRTAVVILKTVKSQFALVYLKDVVIFFKTSEEHFRYIREVLTLLNNANITFKLKKCQLFVKTVDYQGHVIRPRRLEIASHSTDAIHGLQKPTNITELQSFSGLCNILRQFVPNFCKTSGPTE